jgi:hypothetical protein
MISTRERVEIKPFQAEDMIFIIGDGVKEGNISLYGDANLQSLADNLVKDGMSMTGYVDGKIVACGGIKKLWDGVGEVWLMLSPEIDKLTLRTGECIFRGLDELIRNNDFVRLQGWCRKDFVKAHTLFKHLGFTPEGVARKYTPDGVDCILYGKVA